MPHPNPPRDGREQQTLWKNVPLSGGRAACGGGGKVQFMRVVGAESALKYSTAVFNLNALGLYFT